MLCVTPHLDLDDVNEQARRAGEAGWRITALTVADGHVNLGRTMVGFWLAGPLGAAVATSRKQSLILVSWERSPQS